MKDKKINSPWSHPRIESKIGPSKTLTQKKTALNFRYFPKFRWSYRRNGDYTHGVSDLSVVDILWSFFISSAVCKYNLSPPMVRFNTRPTNPMHILQMHWCKCRSRCAVEDPTTTSAATSAVSADNQPRESFAHANVYYTTYFIVRSIGLNGRWYWICNCLADYTHSITYWESSRF